MKLRCDRQATADALAAVARAASSRGPINVLGGIRLEALSDRVVLAATDTELALRVATPATVLEDGVGVVPARTLVDLVRKLPDGPLSIETEELPTIRVASGEGEYRLNALSALDFPEIPAPVTATSVRVERAALTESFARVGRAAARDMSRPVYTGVVVGIEDGLLTMVATDGHRLAVCRRRVEATSPLPPTLIAARALAELARLPISADFVELLVAENVVVFEAGDYRLTARRLNGQLQPWQQLIAGDFAHEAIVDHAQLLASLDRAAVLVQRGTSVTLEFAETELVVSVTSAEVGTTRERVPVQIPGPTIAVSFNPAYLIDGLQMIDTDDVRIRLNDGLRPVVLESLDGALTYLVAPMRRPG